MRNSTLASLAAAFLVLSGGFAERASGEELREFYRGARAQAMGNAFVGLADDEQAIFLNPAGLAGLKRYGVQYFIADIEGSTDILAAAQNRAAYNNLSGDTLNEVMGKNIYGRVQLTPSFTMPNFGISVIVDGQAAVLAKNQALPQIVLGDQMTNGLQFAWGQSVMRARAKSKHDLRVGVGGKLLWRRGGYRLLSLTQMMNVSRDSLQEIVGKYQRGYGIDFGLQYLRTVNSRLKIGWGLVWTDIGDTKFGTGPDPIKSNMATGIAATYQLPKLSTTLLYDYRHLLETADWKKKSHAGVEFALPMISVYAGISQAFFTYGASFDAWIFKVTALSYAEEQGSYVQDDTERRFMLRLALKVGL
ncbi:MAG TPA: hypothetical protein VJB59_07270 [Bdellovibrionota bacterium]|nr:hypothetical protein [Bdellovibrionota bacterium]